MNRLPIKTIIALLFPLSFTGCAKNKSLPEFKSTRIIIVIMDGARYSETWGDTSHQYIPYLHQLAVDGCVFTDFRKENHTYTCSGHTEILTGVDQEIDNNGNELPQYASFMQYALAAEKLPSAKAYIISSKDKLHVLADCQDEAMAGKHNPVFLGGINGVGSGYCHDSVTIQRVYQIMSTLAPDFILINFREPDFSAHAGDTLGYHRGIAYVDSCFHLIYQWVQALPAYRGQTALFLTNDHGRHLDAVSDGFMGHGDNCEGCRHIFCFATGPDFQTHCIIQTRYYLKDLAATVARMQTLVMPHNSGSFIQEMFR